MREVGVKITYSNDLREARAEWQAYVKEMESRVVRIPVSLEQGGQRASSDTVATMANPGGVAPGNASAAATRLERVSDVQSTATALANGGVNRMTQLFGPVPNSGGFGGIAGGPLPVPGSSGMPWGAASPNYSYLLAQQSNQIVNGLTPTASPNWSALLGQQGQGQLTPTPNPRPSPSGFGGRSMYRTVAIGLLAAREAANVVQKGLDYDALVAGGSIEAGNDPVAQARLHVQEIAAQQEIGKAGAEAIPAIGLAAVGGAIGSAFLPGPGTAIGLMVGYGAGKIAGDLGYSAFSGKSNAIESANASRAATAAQYGFQDNQDAIRSRISNESVGVSGIGAEIIGVSQAQQSMDAERRVRQIQNPESLPALIAAQAAKQDGLALQQNAIDQKLQVQSTSLSAGPQAAQRLELQNQIDNLQDADINARTRADTFPTDRQSAETQKAIDLLQGQIRQIDQQQGADVAQLYAGGARAQGEVDRNPVESLDAEHDAANQRIVASYRQSDPRLQAALVGEHDLYTAGQQLIQRNNREATSDLRGEDKAIKYALNDQPLQAQLQRIQNSETQQIRNIGGTGNSLLDDIFGFSSRREQVQYDSDLRQQQARQQFADQTKLIDISQQYQSESLSYGLARNPVGAQAASIAGAAIAEANQLAFGGRPEEAKRAQEIGQQREQLLKQDYQNAFHGVEIDPSMLGFQDPNRVENPGDVLSAIAKESGDIAGAKLGSDAAPPNSPQLQALIDLVTPLQQLISQIAGGAQ